MTIPDLVLLFSLFSVILITGGLLADNGYLDRLLEWIG